MSEERRSYIDTFTEITKKLVEHSRCSTLKPICTTIKFSYRDIFKNMKVKWYIRICRKLFPTRTYIRWRARQALLAILHRKVTNKMDEYLAYGDKID